MDENSRSQIGETSETETESGRLLLRRVVCSSIEDGQTSSSSSSAGAAAVSSSAVLPAAGSCAEWVIVTLLLTAWILSVAAFLHKWKRLRILTARTPVEGAPKNLGAVQVVTDLDQSVIYRSYPAELAATLQARFVRLRRSVSLRLGNLPVIMAAPTRGAAGGQRGTNACPGPGPGSGSGSREPEVMMLSSFPEETSSSISSSSSSASGSSLAQPEVSVEPAEAAASLPEVERSVPEVTVWLPEVTLSLAEVNPSRPEVVMSEEDDPAAVANGYGEDAPRSI